MKKLCLLLLLPAVLLVAALTQLSTAQTPTTASAARWEYGILKWDGPDRIYYNLPGRFELVHLSNKGVERPRNAQDEEYYLAWAANEVAADGWEIVNLDSRRLLLRRPKVN